MPVSHLSQRIKLRSQPFVAADVGGTHARVALLRAGAGRGQFDVLAYRKFACKDFPGLPDLLHTFVEHDAGSTVRCCVIACAGQVMGDTIINDNLVWRVDLPALRRTLDFDDVALLNDFEALGYALDDIGDADALLLSGPAGQVDGPILVVGPGTGLGSAVRFSDSHGARVLATEAGQMDLAPGTPRERDVLVQLTTSGPYVPYEKVLSGPGLLTLYRVLCEMGGRSPHLDTPEAVTAAAREGSDAEAVEALEMFCGLLGSFVGNLALVFMASGGVYLAGGVLPHIREFLQHSRFVERFLDKGGMREFMQRVPIRLIEHGRHGVLGAARWYLEGLQQGGTGRLAMGDGTAA